MKSYRTIEDESYATYIIKRSEFSAIVRGINDYNEGLEFAKAIAKQYHDATHNCYAILCKTGEQKFSDDGEPLGTAGMPILQALKNSGLTDVACVVTRYFGGIKLGASGLISAYTKATADAIAYAKIVTRKESLIYNFSCEYSESGQTTHLVEEIGGKIKQVGYSTLVNMTIAIPIDDKELFLSKIGEAFGGQKYPELNCIKYENY